MVLREPGGNAGSVVSGAGLDAVDAAHMSGPARGAPSPEGEERLRVLMRRARRLCERRYPQLSLELDS